MKFEMDTKCAAICLALITASGISHRVFSADSSKAAPGTAQVGERVPSEDELIPDLHSLGLIQGKTDVFRCASPTRPLLKGSATTQPTEAMIVAARARMQRLHDLGIRTVVSFESPDTGEAGPQDSKNDSTAMRRAWIALEKSAAEQVGLAFVSHPIANAGPNSLETMSDQDVVKLIDPIAAEILADANRGGVVFHCAAGHDRTGLMAAYLRIKYEKWPVEEAIDEMRRYGHNWKKYSHNGGVSSWHEDHLRAVAKAVQADKN